MYRVKFEGKRDSSHSLLIIFFSLGFILIMLLWLWAFIIVKLEARLKLLVHKDAKTDLMFILWTGVSVTLYRLAKSKWTPERWTSHSKFICLYMLFFLSCCCLTFLKRIFTKLWSVTVKICQRSSSVRATVSGKWVGLFDTSVFNAIAHCD